MTAEAREQRLWAEIDALMVNSEDIDAYEADSFSDQIRPAKSWRDDIVTQLYNPQEVLGERLPWLNADGFRLRSGELTIWSGYNGHGKSLVLTQVMAYCITNGAKVTIASLELSPIQTIRRMISQSTGVEWGEITEKSVDHFFEAMDGKLSLYTEVGDIEPHRVLAMCRYVREKLGVDHLVIDSLMKCGTTEGEYSQEKKLVNSLQNIAKNSGLHIHLVAHAKKGKDEFEMPGKFDVSGSTMITNIADNVITISRNKRKEQEKIKLEQNQSIMEKPDAFLNVTKQRHGDWEGIIGLWWHKSQQFLGSDRRVHQYA